MTYEQFVEIALRLPETEEGMSYGTPAVKRGGRLMFRLKEDGDAVALRLSWPDHDRLLAAWPELCFKTPHYEGYPAFLVRLEPLEEAHAQKLAQASWEFAPVRDSRPG